MRPLEAAARAAAASAGRVGARALAVREVGPAAAANEAALEDGWVAVVRAAAAHISHNRVGSDPAIGYTCNWRGVRKRCRPRRSSTEAPMARAAWAVRAAALVAVFVVVVAVAVVASAAVLAAV